MNTSQFSLRWNNYVTNVTEAFNTLRTEDDLVDVTLCCDGGKIKAHKMLLSACSNYFKQIFKENPCQHPVIIFRNFKFEDLNAIINFMYHGEVNIIQEQLESFLITAEFLEVKGLTDNIEEESSQSQIRISEQISLDLSTKSNRTNDFDIPIPINEPINLATLPITEHVAQDITMASQEQDSMVEPTPVIKQEITNSASTEMNPNSNDELLVETHSVPTEDTYDRQNSESDLAKFRCTLCPKGFKHPTSLTLHKDSHAGKTQCPVCLRSFSRSYDMRSHLQRIHREKELTIKEIRLRYKSSDTIASKQFNHNI